MYSVLRKVRKGRVKKCLFALIQSVGWPKARQRAVRAINTISTVIQFPLRFTAPPWFYLTTFHSRFQFCWVSVIETTAVLVVWLGNWSRCQQCERCPRCHRTGSESYKLPPKKSGLSVEKMKEIQRRGKEESNKMGWKRKWSNAGWLKINRLPFCISFPLAIFRPLDNFADLPKSQGHR